jgi:hypothetical protein
MRAEWTNTDGRARIVAVGGLVDMVATRLQLRIGCSISEQLKTLQTNEELTGVDPLADEKCRLLDDQYRTEGDKKNEGDYWLQFFDTAESPVVAIKNWQMIAPDGPNEPLGLGDGYSEIAAGWGILAARDLAVLASLAVAIYLLAQAHAMVDTRAVPWLMSAGLFLFVAASAYGAWAFSRPVLTAAGGSNRCSDKGDSPLSAERAVRVSAQKYVGGVERR